MFIDENNGTIHDRLIDFLSDMFLVRISENECKTRVRKHGCFTSSILGVAV